MSTDIKPPITLPGMGFDMWELVIAWKKLGAPAPAPPIIKVLTIYLYAQALGAKTMVETGTYMGQTTFFLRDFFEEIQTIELDQELFERAQGIFADYPHIHLWQGNSAEVLPKILSTLDRPALFWLDAHYSGEGTARGEKDSPVMLELTAILEHSVRDHVILIDDIRDFGTGDYPRRDEVEKLVQTHRPDLNVTLKHDILRIHHEAAFPQGRLNFDLEL